MGLGLPPEPDSAGADSALGSADILQEPAPAPAPELTAPSSAEELIQMLASSGIMPNLEFDIDWGDLPVERDLQLDLSAEDETELVGSVLDAIIAADEGRSQRMEKVKQVRSRFYLTTPDRKPLFPEGANFHVPFTRWVLDAVNARLWREIFGIGDPVVTVTGVRGSEDVDAASRMEPTLQWMNLSELKLPEQFDFALERVSTDGDIFAKVPWRRITQPFRRRRLESVQEILTSEGGLPTLDAQGAPTIRIIQRYVVEERQEVLYQGPTVELVTVDNFIMPNPNERDLGKQPWLAQQFYLSREALWADRIREVQIDGEAHSEGIYPEEAVRKIISFQRREDTAPHGMEQQADVREGVSGVQIGADDLIGEARCYEIIWPYRAWMLSRALRANAEAKVDSDLWPERAVLVIAADAKVLLRAIEYPFWEFPRCYFARICAIESEGRAYSQAPGEILMPVQDELDTIHWQRTDATTVMIMAFFTFLAEEGAADDLNSITLGAKNKVSSLDGVKLLSDVIKIAIQVPGLDIESLVLKFGELLSGISDSQLGRITGGGTTAYEVGSVIREGSVKFSRMIATLGRSIVAIDKLALRRYAQFYPMVKDKLARIRGTEADVISDIALSDLNFDYDLELRGTSIAINKEIQAAKAFRMLQLSEESTWVKVLLIANPGGIYELVRQVLEQIDWPGGAETLIGKKDKAIQVLSKLVGPMVAAILGPQQQPGAPNPSGNGGPMQTDYKAISALLNDSGLTPEMSAVGATATGGTLGG